MSDVPHWMTLSGVDYYEWRLLDDLAQGCALDVDMLVHYLALARKARRKTVPIEIMMAAAALLMPTVKCAGCKAVVPKDSYKCTACGAVLQKRLGRRPGAKPLEAWELAVVDLYEHVEAVKRGEGTAEDRKHFAYFLRSPRNRVAEVAEIEPYKLTRLVRQAKAQRARAQRRGNRK